MRSVCSKQTTSGVCALDVDLRRVFNCKFAELGGATTLGMHSEGGNQMESTMRYVMALAAILPAFAFAASATSAAETGKFCLKGPATTINCTYDTMASCDKAKTGTQTCVANPAATTGSGANGSTSSPMSPTQK